MQNISKDIEAIEIAEEKLFGWRKLSNIGVAEIWKTPTKYLAGIHYLDIAKFCNSLDQAKAIARKLNEDHKEKF